MSTEFVDLATLRLLNESAIHNHALACSQKFRAGKFTRVGEDFQNEVRADVEAFIREIRNKWPTPLHEPLPLDENACCVTGALSDKVMAALNDAIARLIQSKVQKQPSVGCTLRATR
jgi:hypothetical protein